MSLPLGDAQRRRLHESFAALCAIPSVTGDERACADWISGQLRAMGLEVSEDLAGQSLGGNAGNLLARIPGTGNRMLLLCAHMDTVPLSAELEPVREAGGWTNAGDGILGADNKSAVAALVELARILCAAPAPPNVGVELLFTVAEETGLQGASQFDASQLQSGFGYVFDHASPWGEIIAASPTHVRLDAEFRGCAAHAGMAPEQGVSAVMAAARGVAALPQGRLDPQTTANVGVIHGGVATNVVADRCSVAAELRSVDEQRVQELVTQALDALQDAADSGGCDLDVSVERLFSGYRLDAREPSVALAERALRRLGLNPRMVSTGGGSDANALRAMGFQCTNIANGTERPHERTERVSDEALETGLAMLLALIEEAADAPSGASGSAGR